MHHQRNIKDVICAPSLFIMFYCQQYLYRDLFIKIITDVVRAADVCILNIIWTRAHKTTHKIEKASREHASLPRLLIPL